MSREQELVQGLLEIICLDSQVIEGSSNKPVIWTNECAGIAKRLLESFGCQLTRDEQLKLIRDYGKTKR